MSRKKKEEELEPICYFCETWPKLPILRREGDNGNIAKECNGKTIVGRYPPCDNFTPCKYFWCDHHQVRLSLENCQTRKNKPYSECPEKCPDGLIAKSIMPQTKTFKRIEVKRPSEDSVSDLINVDCVEVRKLEDKVFKRVEIKKPEEHNDTTPNLGIESQSRGNNMGSGSGRNKPNQKRQSLSDHLDRIFG